MHHESMNTDEPALTAAELAEVRAAWEAREVAGYLRLLAPVTAGFGPAVASAVGCGTGGRLLDVGAGDGWLTKILSARDWKCLTLDRSAEMARHAARRLGNGRVAVADASALPLAAGSLDAVAAAFLLPHVTDLDRLFAELHRVLRSGGRLVTTTWPPPAQSPFLGLPTTAVLAGADEQARRMSTDVDVRQAPDAVRSALHGAGFTGFRMHQVDQVVRLASAEEWWNAVISGSASTGAMWRAQPPQSRALARAEFLRAASSYATGDAVVVPAPGLLISAGVA